MNEKPTIPNYSELVKKGRDSVIDTVHTLEKIQYNAGFDVGFNAGWDACVRRFIASVKTEAEQKPPEPPTPPPQPKQAALSFSFDDRASNNDIVLRAIANAPGLRGVELVGMMDNTTFTIPERTVRTCLHRLKKLGKIMSVDGRWYTKEAALDLTINKALDANND
jgi:hypothetical protein